MQEMEAKCFKKWAIICLGILQKTIKNRASVTKEDAVIKVS